MKDCVGAGCGGGKKAIPQQVQMSNRAKLATSFSGHVTDSDSTIAIFQTEIDGTKYRAIPYATADNNRTAHGYLTFLHQLATMSNTQAACIKSRMSMAFGGKLKVERGIDNLFSFDEENTPLEIKTKTAFAAVLKNEVAYRVSKRKSDLRGLLKSVAYDTYVGGNGFFMLTFIDTNGVISAFIDYVPDLQVLPLSNTKDGSIEHVAISASFADANVFNATKKVVALYPNFTETKNGSSIVSSTVFWVQNGTSKGVWGRPDSFASVKDQYVEYLDKDYLHKTIDGRLVPDIILQITMPTEDGVMNTDQRYLTDPNFSVVESLEKEYTNKAIDPQSVMVVYNFPNSPPIGVTQIPKNTDNAFHDFVLRNVEMEIIKAHNWSKVLLGEDAKGGLGGNDAYMQAALMRLATIENDKSHILTALNDAISEIVKRKGLQGFDNVSLGVENWIDEYAKKKMMWDGNNPQQKTNILDTQNAAQIDNTTGNN